MIEPTMRITCKHIEADSMIKNLTVHGNGTGNDPYIPNLSFTRIADARIGFSSINIPVPIHIFSTVGNAVAVRITVVRIRAGCLFESIGQSVAIGVQHGAIARRRSYITGGIIHIDNRLGARTIRVIRRYQAVQRIIGVIDCECLSG